MEINKEPKTKFSIQTYDTESITVQDTKYTSSTIISKNHIESNWDPQTLSDLNANNIQSLLSLNPEIIIIGHNKIDEQIPIEIRALLTKHRIGIESMSVGAACSTFNILLNEDRKVVYAFITSSAGI
jgi:uncharacterized protein